MKRNKTLINNLKYSINEARDSTIFVQHLYESTNFNVNTDTEDVLRDYFKKNSFQNSGEQRAFSKFRKGKLDNKEQLGRKYAKIFIRNKLKFKEDE